MAVVADVRTGRGARGLRAFLDGTRGRWQVSNGGAVRRVGRDGVELFYLQRILNSSRVPSMWHTANSYGPP